MDAKKPLAQMECASQMTALALVLNSLFLSQFVHLRSVVGVGSVDTFVPAEQVRVVVQTRGEVAEPADDWYCKLVHVTYGLQLLCPASSWYVSIAHALQVGAPAADTKPAGHGEHAVWPSRDWERPSSHATQ